MKTLYLLLIMFLSLGQIQAQEFYLIDSVRSVVFFGFDAFISSKKFTYDENHRLIHEVHSNNVSFRYYYDGEFDYRRDYYSYNSQFVNNRNEYFHNSDGHLLEELIYQKSQTSNELVLTGRFTYLNSASGLVLKRKEYYYNELQQELLRTEIFYQYENDHLVQKTTTNFDLNQEPYYIITETSEYTDDLLVSYHTNYVYNSNTQETLREYSYGTDGQLEMVEVINYSNSNITSEQLELYSHNSEGDTYMRAYWKNLQTQEYQENMQQYISEMPTRFYQQDTTIITWGDSLFSSEELRTYSHYYSSTGDTAFVRRFISMDDFEFSGFKSIDKEIHLRYNQGPVLVKETESVGFIYPNPIKKHTTALLQVDDAQIDKLVVYNAMGQRVLQKAVLYTGTQPLAIELEAGSYFGQFYSEGNPIGKAINLLVIE